MNGLLPLRSLLFRFNQHLNVQILMFILFMQKEFRCRICRRYSGGEYSSNVPLPASAECTAAPLFIYHGKGAIWANSFVWAKNNGGEKASKHCPIILLQGVPNEMDHDSYPISEMYDNNNPLNIYKCEKSLAMKYSRAAHMHFHMGLRNSACICIIHFRDANKMQINQQRRAHGNKS